MRTLADIIHDSRADWGIAIRGTNTDYVFEHRSDVVYETASIIKLPILILLLQQVQAGKLSLRQAVNVRPHHVGLHGSGQLANLYLHLPFELYNLAMLMMTISDNVATNAIIELLGGHEAINAGIRALGYHSIRLRTNRLHFPSSYQINHDWTSQGTAAELVSFMAGVQAGQFLDEPNTAKVLKMLRRAGTSQLSRQLPSKQVDIFGSKTGMITMDAKQPVVLGEVGYLQTATKHIAVFAVLQQAPFDRRLPWSPDAKFRLEMAKVGAAMLRELQ